MQSHCGATRRQRGRIALCTLLHSRTVASAGKAASNSTPAPSSWDVDGKAPEAPELGYLGDRQLISLADGVGAGSTLSPLAMVRRT